MGELGGHVAAAIVYLKLDVNRLRHWIFSLSLSLTCGVTLYTNHKIISGIKYYTLLAQTYFNVQRVFSLRSTLRSSWKFYSTIIVKVLAPRTVTIYSLDVGEVVQRISSAEISSCFCSLQLRWKKKTANLLPHCAGWRHSVVHKYHKVTSSIIFFCQPNNNNKVEKFLFNCLIVVA